MKVGFIGLGNLGTAIARRLISQGYTLTVWNRTRARAGALDATVALSPRAVIEANNTIFVCLFDSAAVRDVLQGPDGLLGSCRGKTIIDLSTNHFRDVAAFHELVTAAGGNYLEAPVLGSVIPAGQGALTVLISGREAVYADAKPLLDVIGKNLFYLPPPGQATRLKLVNNLVLGTIMAGIANAVALAEAAGITRQQALDILAAGAGNSAVLNAKREKLLQRDYSPHFSAALIHKDLTCLNDLARECEIPNTLGETVRALFEQTLADDPHHRDLAVVYEVLSRAGKQA